jgi:hypothetical protein
MSLLKPSCESGHPLLRGVERCSAGSTCRVFWLEVNPIESLIARLIHDSSVIGRHS